MLGAAAEEGSLFRFSLPPDYEVIDAVIESAKTIKKNELPEADAMVVFSCVGRLSQLGPMLSAELDGLASTWNKPMAGFSRWENMGNWTIPDQNFMEQQ